MKVYIFVVKVQYPVKDPLRRKYCALRKTVIRKLRLKPYGNANCFTPSLNSHRKRDACDRIGAEPPKTQPWS